MSAKASRYFAAQAWVQGRWAKDVLLEVEDGAYWSRISCDASACRVADAEVELRFSMSRLSRARVPLDRLARVRRDARAVLVAEAEVVLRGS